MPLSTRFRFTVKRPEADRGKEAGGGEENAIIGVDMQFPLDCSTCDYHFIGDLSIAEIRLCFVAVTTGGSSDVNYQQIYNWCNFPSERPDDGDMSLEMVVAWSDARVWLTSYPNTHLSELELS